MYSTKRTRTRPAARTDWFAVQVEILENDRVVHSLKPVVAWLAEDGRTPDAVIVDRGRLTRGSCRDSPEDAVTIRYVERGASESVIKMLVAEAADCLRRWRPPCRPPGSKFLGMFGRPECLPAEEGTRT